MKERLGRSAAEMIYGTTLRLPGEFTYVSRANGNGGGLRTYSRIPLHLRGKTPGAADTVIDSTKSKHAHIANREKISTDQTVRKTRVGRIIQTPARFVQMVHAIVAPNDIYGGPNRIPRNNNVVKL